MRMRVYLSGPMTGLPDLNFAEFHRIAEKLRFMGFEVVNPAESFAGRQDLPREVYMRRDIFDVLQVQMLVQMWGWEKSSGANLEMLVAKNVGIPIWELQDKF